MPSISFDKIQDQRQKLIQEQNQQHFYLHRKAQNAFKKIDHNLNVLISSIPSILLNQNIGSLLKRTDGDLNVAIYEQQLKIYQHNQKSTSNSYIHDDQLHEKGWNNVLEKSPPKMQNKKRIIKNNKKK